MLVALALIERYYNLNTSQFAIKSSGIFNTSTIYSPSKIPFLSYLLVLIPFVGLLYPLVNLRCAYPKLPEYFSKYYRIFYSSAKNWLFMGCAVLFVYCIYMYEGKVFALIKQTGLPAIPLVTLLSIVIPLYIRFKRKRRVVKYIRLHSDYINTASPVIAENIKENTYILARASEIFSNMINSVQPVQSSPIASAQEVFINATNNSNHGVSAV